MRNPGLLALPILAGALAACSGTGGGEASLDHPKVTRQGLIAISQEAAAGGTSTTYAAYATARFYEFAGEHAPIDPECHETQLGSCAVTDCALGTSWTAAGTRPARAGTLTIHGGLLAEPLTLTPKSASYTVPVVSRRLFLPNDTLTVSGSGDEVPAFSGSVPAPDDLTLITPKAEVHEGTRIPRAGDLAVTWTGGGRGKVQVSLGSWRDDGRSVSVACVFPAESGRGEVPGAALARLDRPGKTTRGTLTAVPFDERTLASGGWDITFRVMGTRKTVMLSSDDD